jgi:glyoxylase-like metal-dependent hydrolase (beta-lactamase superfamily II)
MQITPSLWGVDFQGRVWAYLYRDAGGFTLIDAGIAGHLDVVEAALTQAGGRLADLKQIILTHCHRDHTGTLAELQAHTPSPALVHTLDAAYVRGTETVPDPVLSPAEQALFDQLAGDIPDAPPALVHRELQHGDPLDIGAGAQAVHVPGHTPGSIAVYLPGERLLFTGDAAACISGNPIVGVFNIDPAQAKDSFRRLTTLNFETAAFGHGPPITTAASTAFTRTAESLQP